MSPLTLFTGPYGFLAKWAVIGLILLAAFATGWVKGDQHGTKKLADYQVKQAQEAAKIVVKQGQATERVVVKYQKVKGDTLVVKQAVEKEVIQYVDKNPGYCLDADWRRLHDAAATNAVPSTASGINGPGTAPTAATALTTVTGNYAICHETENRLTALQGWVKAQQAVRP